MDTVLCSSAMAKKTVGEQKGGAWIFRNIPRDLMKRAKIAAAQKKRWAAIKRAKKKQRVA